MSAARHQIPAAGLGCGAIAIIIIFGGLLALGHFGLSEFETLVETGQQKTVTIVAKGINKVPEPGKTHETGFPYVAVDLRALGGPAEHQVSVALKTLSAVQIGSSTTWYYPEGDPELGAAEIQRAFMSEYADQGQPALWWLFGAAAALWTIAVGYHVWRHLRQPASNASDG